MGRLGVYSQGSTVPFMTRVERINRRQVEMIWKEIKRLRGRRRDARGQYLPDVDYERERKRA